jgi:hypothetical protein
MFEDEELAAERELARMDADDRLRRQIGNKAYFALTDEERERRIEAMVSGGYEMTIDPPDPVDPSPQFEFRLSPAQALKAVVLMERRPHRLTASRSRSRPRQTRARRHRSTARHAAATSRGDPSRPDDLAGPRSAA